MSGWDTSKTKWAENFSCLNMNYDALDNAGCFEQDREGTLKLLRTGNERDKFAKARPVEFDDCRAASKQPTVQLFTIRR